MSKIVLIVIMATAAAGYIALLVLAIKDIAESDKFIEHLKNKTCQKE